MAKKNLSPNPLVSILIFALVLVSFLAGVLWTKVQTLEKNILGVQKENPQTQNTTSSLGESPLGTDNLKKYAKELKLNTNEFNSCLDSHKHRTDVNSDISQGNELAGKLWDADLINHTDVPNKTEASFGTPTFFINGLYVSGAQPFDTFKQILDEQLGRKPKSENSPRFEVNVTGQSQGSENAPVTMVEFSDFECPFCGQFHNLTFNSLKSEYIDKGLVRFIYKHYPLTEIAPSLKHTHAINAAEASLCAADQGKFWEYHNKLFESQK